ncbi:competence regulator inhibitor paratox [Streptococcus canis]
MLPNEEVRPWEMLTEERVEEVLMELDK